MSARAGTVRGESRIGFACPACGGAGALVVLRRLVLPGDRRADEIALEIAACGCGLKALVVAEQLQVPGTDAASLRAAARDGASAERIGFRLPAAAVDLFAFLIASCPEPAEEYCDCPAHRALNRRDLRDRWNVLHSFAPVAGVVLAPLPLRAGGPAPAYAYAPLSWTKAAETETAGGCAAVVEGRAWRVAPVPGVERRYELAIGDALEFAFGPWPPFWQIESG